MRDRRRRLAAFACAGIAAIGAGASSAGAFTQNPATVFINEIHYDNTGTDAGETIEIAGPAGTDLTGWSVVLYNGTGGAVYDTDPLTGTIPDQGGGFGTVTLTYPANGIQNGSPDGVALVNGTTVVQFLSYEGAFAAVGGAANGLTSTDIGVTEAGTEPIGQSLRLTGTGSRYQDFAWQGPATSGFGAVNTGQNFQAPVGDAAPAVTSTVPLSGASGVSPTANLTVTFSEPVTAGPTAFGLSCAATSVPVSVTGGLGAFTIDPVASLPAGASCTLTVTAAQVSDQDANDPPDNPAADTIVPFTVQAAPCSAADTPIGQIQGQGALPALTGTRTVQGVVVGDYEGPAPTLRGFYVQDAGDGDPLTSDAIFVFNGSANSVSLGQVVQVTGNAGDFQDQTQLSGTLVIEDCGTTGTVAPADIALPIPAPVAGVPYLERFEGMYVRFPQTLYVTEHFQLGRFGQVVMSSGGRLAQPTNVVAPGAPAQALQAQNNLNRIIVDDELQSQNPDPIKLGRGGNPLTAANTLRGGDSLAGLTGVLSYTWAGNAASPNNYRVRPVGDLSDLGPDSDAPVFTPANPRPSARPAVGGRLTVASFNVLNYFLTLDIGTQANCGPDGFKQECRGAESAVELSRQRQKLVQALVKLDADVVGLVEIENTPGVDPAGDIVAGLNAVVGAGRFARIDTGVIGTDAIRVGLIYDTTAVQPSGAFKVLTSAVDPRFDDTRNRPALAQTFVETATGAKLTVAVNHLKSKGASGLELPTSVCFDGNPANDADCDLGDGQGYWNASRSAAAQALGDWLATDPTGAGDTDAMVIGDLNAYAKEDPIAALASRGYVDLLARAGGNPYSFAFDGQWGYLDHALASPSLAAQVTGAAEYHINADEPNVLDYNTNFKSAGQVASLFAPDEFRTSDHDPLVVGVALTRPFAFGGFFGVRTPPLVNRREAGEDMHVGFLIPGSTGAAVFAAGYPRWQETDCTTGARIGAPTPAAVREVSRNRAGRFNIEIDTPLAWAGTCRTLEVGLTDSTVRPLLFRFVRDA